MREAIAQARLGESAGEVPIGAVEVRDGKIALWRDYFDAATIMSKWPVAA